MADLNRGSNSLNSNTGLFSELTLNFCKIGFAKLIWGYNCHCFGNRHVFWIYNIFYLYILICTCWLWTYNYFVGWRMALKDNPYLGWVYLFCNEFATVWFGFMNCLVRVITYLVWVINFFGLDVRFFCIPLVWFVYKACLVCI